ncbi:MAG: alpha-galactosidase [Ruminococcus sp.]
MCAGLHRAERQLHRRISDVQRQLPDTDRTVISWIRCAWSWDCIRICLHGLCSPARNSTRRRRYSLIATAVWQRLSQRFHKAIREHVCRGKYQLAERPVLINNWEATYFDFNEEKILKHRRISRRTGRGYAGAGRRLVRQAGRRLFRSGRLGRE